jgi:hypothetical protein
LKFANIHAQSVEIAAPKARMAMSLVSIQRKSKSSSESPAKAFMINAENGTKTAAITRISISLK